MHDVPSGRACPRSVASEVTRPSRLPGVDCGGVLLLGLRSSESRVVSPYAGTPVAGCTLGTRRGFQSGFLTVMTELDRWGHALRCTRQRRIRNTACAASRFSMVSCIIERRSYNPITAFPFATHASGALQLGVPEGCAVGVCEEGRESIDQRVRR